MAEGSPEERRSDYLAKAEQARLLAASAIDPQAQLSLRQVADGWEYLAQRLALTHLNPRPLARPPVLGGGRHL